MKIQALILSLCILCTTTANSQLTIGTTTVSSGTNTKVLYNNSGVLGEYTVTGSGNVVLATSPTIGNYTLSGAGTSGAATVTNANYDLLIGNGSATSQLRLLPWGSDIFFGNSTTGDLVFRNNESGTPNEYMRIKDGGNVGIGTSSPNQQLEITAAFRMPQSTSSTTGVIYKGADRFLHDYTNVAGGGDGSGRNIFLGKNAGNFTSSDGGSGYTASANIGIGGAALNSLTNGYGNIGIGTLSLFANTGGSMNISIGHQAMMYNTTGYYNLAIGYAAMNLNTTGYQNVGMGFSSLGANTTGLHNTAIGAPAMQLNTTGSYNVGIGNNAGHSNLTGGGNTVVGYNSLYSNTTSYNTGVGCGALYDVTTGQNNTALGYNTGVGITTGGNNTIIGANVTGLSSSLANNIIIADGSGNRRINVDNNGNVGMGTNTPVYKLDILNSLTAQTASNRAANFSTAGATFNTTSGALSSYSGYFSSTSTRSAGSNDLTNVGLYATASGAQENLAAVLDGKVAVGSVTSFPSGYKLAVAGNIIAEKVRVKLQSGWPDYVFDKKYPLPTLKETEQFIQQNNHLPGVPSAAQIEKEGLDLGDGQAVLLKKIEELTLHLIELDKKVEKLAAENAALRKRQTN